MPLTVLKVPAKELLSTTVKWVKKMAWEAKHIPAIKATAVYILNEAGITHGRNRQKSARAITDWVYNNIRFFNDPHHVETVQTPQQTLLREYGDCDDMAVLMGALLMSMGIEVQYRIVGIRQPEHIHIEAMTEKGWHGFDPAVTMGDPRPAQLKTFLIEGYRGKEYAL